MLVSIHLPPPVMIESTDSLAFVTHILVLELRHVFFGRRHFGERPRQHELGLEPRPCGFDHAVDGCGHPAPERKVHARGAAEMWPGPSRVDRARPII